MVNNISKIQNLLQFNSEDDFYHLQIIKRKKEHKELGSNSMIIKTYYIKSLDHLDKIAPEMISLCDFHNARGCINLNKRSFEKVAFHCLRKLTDQIMNKDFKSAKDAYNSVCGSHSNENEKKWIIDFDEKDFMSGFRLEQIKDSIVSFGGKVLEILETKNGFHIITNSFRLDLFKKEYPELEIHKDNPTILYIP